MWMIKSVIILIDIFLVFVLIMKIRNIISLNKKIKSMKEFTNKLKILNKNYAENKISYDEFIKQYIKLLQPFS